MKKKISAGAASAASIFFHLCTETNVSNQKQHLWLTDSHVKTLTVCLQNMFVHFILNFIIETL